MDPGVMQFSLGTRNSEVGGGKDQGIHHQRGADP